MSRWLAVLMACLALGLVAAGCGDDDEDDGNGGAETTEQPADTGAADTGATETGEAGGGGAALALSADAGGDLAFDKDALEASAGEVTITMDNPSSLPHNVSIEGGGVDEGGETVGQGEQSEVSATLEPGEYTFYCSVPGHQEGGMEGTLTVK